MKQNNARDLLLLAAVAFNHGKHSEAGTLFATALSSDGAEELLREIDVEGILDEDTLQSEQASLSSDAPRVGLAAIASSVADAMSHVSLSSDDDEDEPGMPSLADEEDEDSEDDDATDEISDEIPGATVLPSSLSSANQGGGATRKLKLVFGSNSPVRVKQKQ